MRSQILTLGLFDDLENQMQSQYTVDLLRSHLAVLGAAMSGKTTVLKTLLLRMHQELGVTEKEEIYILDFKNNLSSYAGLPCVVACFDALREENVRCIFRRIEERLEENIRELPGMVYAESDDPPAHMTFIIDGLNSFFAEDSYEAYHHSLTRMAREGLSKGLTIVVTADEPSGQVMSLLNAFRSVIALDYTAEQYSTVFGGKTKKPISLRGRGIALVDDSTYEFQAFFPYNSDIASNSDASAVKQLVQQMLARFPAGKRVLEACGRKKMNSFVGDLTRDEWKRYTGESYEMYKASHRCASAELIAGLDYYSFKPIRFDLEKARAVAIYGKKGSGKTNLLAVMLAALKNIPDVRFVVWEDSRENICSPSRGGQAYKELSEAKDMITLRSQKDLEEFLFEKGYFDTRSQHEELLSNAGNSQTAGSRTRRFVPRTNPFTVFIMQSRLLYHATGFVNDHLIGKLSPWICDTEGIGRRIFIFSDAQRITDYETNTVFNACLDYAFLLEDILRFVNDRGQKSVFGTQNPDDLKTAYGKCERGDGYFFDLEGDDLHKLKFIKWE